jgi:hypothetical protein
MSAKRVCGIDMAFPLATKVPIELYPKKAHFEWYFVPDIQARLTRNRAVGVS